MTLLALAAAAVVAWSTGQSATNDLQALINATPEGATLLLKPGTYSGGIVIDRTMTLDGNSVATIDGMGQGDCVEIRAPGVTLRNLAIKGSALGMNRENAGISIRAPRAHIESCSISDAHFGIIVTSADATVLRGNAIRGADLAIARRGDAIKVYQSESVVIEHNVIRDGRDLVIWFSSGAIIRANEVRDSRYGLHFMYSHSALIEENRLENNSVGIFLMFSNDLVLRRNLVRGSRGPSGYALGFKDMDRATVEDNVFIANRVGLFLDNSPQEAGVWNTISSNLFAWNDIGIVSQPSVKHNRIVGNSFVENRQQVSVNAGGTLKGNDLAREGKGNFWSDYGGYDIDGDGVGEIAHAPRDAFARLVDRHPDLRIFAFSPAEAALDFAARAVPVFQPEPACVDPSPLMEPVKAKRLAEASGGSRSIGLLGAGFIACSLGLLWPAWGAKVLRRIHS